MSGRLWAILTSIAGLAVLAIFVAFATQAETRAVQDASCAWPNGVVIQFEFARNADDLSRIFGAPGSDCRPLVVAAMDAVNHLDMLAFIPAYTLFCLFGAMFLSGGKLRLLTVAALGAALFAAAADYLETTSLLGITQNLDAPGELMVKSQLGAWSKFTLLAAHAVFCAGLCYTAEKQRMILGTLLMLPAFGVAAAAYNHVTLAAVMNLTFTIAWTALLVMAIVALVRKQATA